MSVHYVTGNALDFPNGANVLLHLTNTLGGVFGAGIAKQIAEEYPAALEADKEAATKGANRLGWFSVAEVGNGKRVLNLYGQSDIGMDRRQIDYEALYTGLIEVAATLEKAHGEGRVYTLCMPWIGTGLAGGARSIVKAMIEDAFGDSPINVYVVERPAKQ